MLAVLPIFRLISGLGGVAEEEMRLAFNMGVGFLMVTPERAKSSGFSRKRERTLPRRRDHHRPGVLYRKAEA
jgi:phosphoribosylaminoimidazole (AIR) synthetase